MDVQIQIALLRAEVDRLLLENWQLKAALGYPVPSEIPQGSFVCGLCEARAGSAKMANPNTFPSHRPI